MRRIILAFLAALLLLPGVVTASASGGDVLSAQSEALELDGLEDAAGDWLPGVELEAGLSLDEGLQSIVDTGSGELFGVVRKAVRSGVLLLHSPEYRDWWISARGYGITVFTDAGIEYIGERITPFLADGDNYGAYSEFADLCDKFLSRAETGSPYDTGSLPAKPLGLTAIAVSLLIGFILAMLIIGIMVSKLKSVRRKADADNYIKAGSMRVTGSRDMFLYRSVSRRERPKNNSGGSSAHRSSSGARHSGGGGKY